MNTAHSISLLLLLLFQAGSGRNDIVAFDSYSALCADTLRCFCLLGSSFGNEQISRTTDHHRFRSTRPGRDDSATACPHLGPERHRILTLGTAQTCDAQIPATGDLRVGGEDLRVKP